MKAITQTTCEQAWLEAAEYLAEASARTEYNLIIEITKPTLHEAADHRIRAAVDHFLRSYDAYPVSTVAGTIFPAAEYVNHGARGVYEIYPEEVYPEIRLGGPSDWGRYAYRLVRWPTSSKTPFNPLQTLVEKMKKQLGNRKRMRACYELSLIDSAIDLPLYDPVRDGRLPRTGPCLSHISLKLGATDILYLTAVYRSHNYVSKALGNFLGLAALQGFICDETGLTPGPLVSVSSYARLEAEGGWSGGEALQLVKSARLAYKGEAHEAA